MNYIVYDLEFNQKYISSNTSDKNNNESIDSTMKQLPFEIIQIGAVKINENLEITSNFNELIRPIVYTDINPYVENITKINKDMLSNCETFSSVYKRFLSFIGNEESILCVWGKSDIKEFIRNIKFNNLQASLFPSRYIDVQKYTSKFFTLQKGTQIGLKTAVELLNIDFEDNFHDAFYDAFYTYEVYKKIYNPSITPKVYNDNNRVNKSKVKLDTNALFNQFSKMYNKELTVEEKSMIKTAYNMGRTGQFIK
ncbi:3'-5' exonuclease [Clostridium tertium]|uniref:3'-5' exonuclease n=1 Tax=Clostridium tertium TaxID=1559 RepID=UPI0024B342AF|nr:3'-5' exonuclease [Clostridium tertium]MDI9217762.1 exonuclease domain-containing protein [Clostridium tertium]